MKCTTIKNGIECAFMTPNGCTYKNGSCSEAVKACDGCNRSQRLDSGWYCAACPEPSLKWKNGNCNLATHVTSETVARKEKLNPLKASKRGAK